MAKLLVIHFYVIMLKGEAKCYDASGGIRMRQVSYLYSFRIFKTKKKLLHTLSS